MTAHYRNSNFRATEFYDLPSSGAEMTVILLNKLSNDECNPVWFWILHTEEYEYTWMENHLDAYFGLNIQVRLIS